MLAYMPVIAIIILDNEFASSRIGIRGEIYGILRRTSLEQIHLYQLSQVAYKIIL